MAYLKDKSNIKGDHVLLVFSMPTSCSDCPLNDPYNECCKASKTAYNASTLGNSRPDFCPLKSMFSNEQIMVPSGMCMHIMKDPKCCNSCLVNDFWGHCCRVTKSQYTYEQYNGNQRLPDCPIMDLYRDQEGSFKVVGNYFINNS